MLENETKIQQKTYGEGRRCKECGKIISIYNDSDLCFRHSLVRVKDIDEKERVFWREIRDMLCDDPVPTICTSRTTRGFNRAQADYQGFGIQED